METLHKYDEMKLRESSWCVCGSRKSWGCVVCWNCFKYRTDITPLKYYNGDVFEWIKEMETVESKKTIDVECELCDGGGVVCKECDGMGEYITCESCDGTGFITEVK